MNLLLLSIAFTFLLIHALLIFYIIIITRRLRKAEAYLLNFSYIKEIKEFLDETENSKDE